MLLAPFPAMGLCHWCNAPHFNAISCNGYVKNEDGAVTIFQIIFPTFQGAQHPRLSLHAFWPKCKRALAQSLKEAREHLSIVKLFTYSFTTVLWFCFCWAHPVSQLHSLLERIWQLLPTLRFCNFFFLKKTLIILLYFYIVTCNPPWGLMVKGW